MRDTHKKGLYSVKMYLNLHTRLLPVLFLTYCLPHACTLLRISILLHENTQTDVSLYDDRCSGHEHAIELSYYNITSRNL